MFHPHWAMSNTIVLRTLVEQRTRPPEDGCPSPRQTIDRCSPHRSNRGAAWLTDRPFSASRPMRTRTPRWPTSGGLGSWPRRAARPVAAAVLVKGIDGKLRVHRDDTTTPDLSWCGALIGGALAVVAAPLAVAPLSVVASQDGSRAGIGGVVEYFWHHIPKSQLLQMSDLIESGQAALVIVAVDHRDPTSKPCCGTPPRPSSPRPMVATSSRPITKRWPRISRCPDHD